MALVSGRGRAAAAGVARMAPQGGQGPRTISDEFPLPVDSKDCPEEVLDPHSIAHGFQDFAAGIQETEETKLTLVPESKLWSAQVLQNLHQAFRLGLRDFKAGQARKRKDTVVYGEPLADGRVAPFGYPQQTACDAAAKKAWEQELRTRKKLRVMSERVPFGYRQHHLFKMLFEENIPILRAVWCIKVVYLNQAGTAPERSSLWTLHLQEALSKSLQEIMSTAPVGAVTHSQHKERPVTLGHHSQMQTGNGSQRPKGAESNVSEADNGCSALQTWQYLLRLTECTVQEGLCDKSSLVTWYLKQLSECASSSAVPDGAAGAGSVSGSTSHVGTLGANRPEMPPVGTRRSLLLMLSHLMPIILLLGPAQVSRSQVHVRKFVKVVLQAHWQYENSVRTCINWQVPPEKKRAESSDSKPEKRKCATLAGHGHPSVDQVRKDVRSNEADRELSELADLFPVVSSANHLLCEVLEAAPDAFVALDCLPLPRAILCASDDPERTGQVLHEVCLRNSVLAASVNPAMLSVKATEAYRFLEDFAGGRLVPAARLDKFWETLIHCTFIRLRNDMDAYAYVSITEILREAIVFICDWSVRGSYSNDAFTPNSLTACRVTVASRILAHIVSSESKFEDIVRSYYGIACSSVALEAWAKHGQSNTVDIHNIIHEWIASLLEENSMTASYALCNRLCIFLTACSKAMIFDVRRFFQVVVANGLQTLNGMISLNTDCEGMEVDATSGVGSAPDSSGLSSLRRPIIDMLLVELPLLASDGRARGGVGELCLQRYRLLGAFVNQGMYAESRLATAMVEGWDRIGSCMKWPGLSKDQYVEVCRSLLDPETCCLEVRNLLMTRLVDDARACLSARHGSPSANKRKRTDTGFLCSGKVVDLPNVWGPGMPTPEQVLACTDILERAGAVEQISLLLFRIVESIEEEWHELSALRSSPDSASNEVEDVAKESSRNSLERKEELGRLIHCVCTSLLHYMPLLKLQSSLAKAATVVIRLVCGPVTSVVLHTSTQLSPAPSSLAFVGQALSVVSDDGAGVFNDNFTKALRASKRHNEFLRLSQQYAEGLGADTIHIYMEAVMSVANNVRRQAFVESLRGDYRTALASMERDSTDGTALAVRRTEALNQMCLKAKALRDKERVNIGDNADVFTSMALASSSIVECCMQMLVDDAYLLSREDGQRLYAHRAAICIEVAVDLLRSTAANCPCIGKPELGRGIQVGAVMMLVEALNCAIENYSDIEKKTQGRMHNSILDDRRLAEACPDQEKPADSFRIACALVGGVGCMLWRCFAHGILDIETCLQYHTFKSDFADKPFRVWLLLSLGHTVWVDNVAPIEAHIDGTGDGWLGVAGGIIRSSCPVHEQEAAERRRGTISAPLLFPSMFGLFQSVHGLRSASLDTAKEILIELLRSSVLESPTICGVILPRADIVYSKLIDWLEGSTRNPEACSKAYGTCCAFLQALRQRKVGCIDMKAPKQIGEIGKALNGFHEPHELRLWSEEVRLRLDWHVYEYLARKMPASDMPQFLNRKRMEGPDVNLKLKLEDPEKDFTEIYLAQLLEHPERASQYAEVLENLGHAVEEHTILEVKWLLERDLKKYRDGGVRYQLRRFKSNFKLEEGDEVRRGIFDLELALVNLTLPCLSRNKKMQVDFVKSLLLQLQRISELMSRTQSVSDGANDNVGTPMKPEDQPLSEKDEKSILAVALWLRLHLLLPLLPIVYSTRPERCAGGSGDARMQSMREQLIRTCLRLTACPIVQEGVSLDKDLEDAQRLGGSVEDSSEMVGADAERSASASGMCKLSMGEGLFNVIVAILHALLDAQWASWLQGNRKRLQSPDSVPEEASIQRELRQTSFPHHLRPRIWGAFNPLPKEQIMGIGLPDEETDPWRFLEEDSGNNSLRVSQGRAGSGVQAAFWLAGAVRKPRGTLAFSLGE